MYKVYHRYSSRESWRLAASFVFSFDAYNFAFSDEYPFVKIISPDRRVLFNASSCVISADVRQFISEHAYYLDASGILSNWKQAYIFEHFKTL